MSGLQAVLNWVERSRDDMVQFMVDLLKIKAVNPTTGGKGEYARALFVQSWLENLGIKVTRHEIPDSRVPEGVRVNLTAVLEGVDARSTLWFITHLDTVPEGPLESWNTDPYQPVVKDGRIFGRGSEDNGQALVSTLFVLKALRAHEARTPTNVGIACVSDEESGNEHGIIPLLKEGVFGRGDICMVPDSGTPDGSGIEVAEKSILWIRFTTKGKQVHGSTPEKGLNAHRVGLKLALELDQFLHSRYAAVDLLFDPPASTFEPTKHELNVDNINTIPGLDVQYFDCRILPQFSLGDVMQDIELLKSKLERETGAQIEVKPVQYEENTAMTPPDCEIVQKLKVAIKELRRIEAKPIGIGGGTIASHLRRKGIQALVWSTADDVAHQPNEYCMIDNMVNDAKVFVHIVMN